ncbi:unnamed protein product, partial [marine sediment metagenome]
AFYENLGTDTTPEKVVENTSISYFGFRYSTVSISTSVVPATFLVFFLNSKKTRQEGGF